jgi:hypothetical protein
MYVVTWTLISSLNSVLIELGLSFWTTLKCTWNFVWGTLLIKFHLFRLSLFTLLSALACKVHTHYRSRLVTWDDVIYLAIHSLSDNWWISKLALKFSHRCGWGFCSDIWRSVMAQQNRTLHLTVGHQHIWLIHFTSDALPFLIKNMQLRRLSQPTPL